MQSIKSSSLELLQNHTINCSNYDFNQLDRFRNLLYCEITLEKPVVLWDHWKNHLGVECFNHWDVLLYCVSLECVSSSLTVGFHLRWHLKNTEIRSIILIESMSSNLSLIYSGLALQTFWQFSVKANEIKAGLDFLCVWVSCLFEKLKDNLYNWPIHYLLYPQNLIH